MRRTLIISAIAITIIGIGLFVYFYFFANENGVVVAPGNVSFPIAGQGTTTPVNGNFIATTSIPVSVTAKLVKISSGPVVPGEVVVNIPAENASSSPTSTTLSTGKIAVKYIERQSGNVYSYDIHSGIPTRTSNKTIPGIQSASWLPDASLVFVRYLSGEDFSTINTYSLPSNVSDDLSSDRQGFFLPQNLVDISVSPTNLLVLASGVNGSVASTENIDGTHMSEVFTTPLSSLRVSFAGKNQYLAFTKPSSTLAGDAFLVNNSGHFFRIAGPNNGLVAVSSPSGEWVLVSYTQDTVMQMELVNTSTGDTIQLPVSTIADKCVWTNDESSIYCGVPANPPSDYSYPDDWYQGVVHFSDRIWKIDVGGRYAQLVLDFPKETKGSLDAEALAIDSLNTTLVFVNKNDSSLWVYSL